MYGSGERRGVRRAHSPDDSFEANNSYRGGQSFRGSYQHQRGSFGYKRHRSEFQEESFSIEDRIGRLGETGSRNSDIGKLALDINSELQQKSQDEDKVKSIVAKICRSIVAFPTRIGAYSTLIGLVSVKHYDIACQIINTLHASYPIYLEAQKWQEAQIIIHLLSSLVNCNMISPSALLSQFEFLLESTLEDNCPQARSDYYVHTVMTSLPHVALKLSESDTQEAFDKLLATIETYLSKRSKAHLEFIRIWKSNDSTLQMDYLDSLWVQIKNFRANGWMESFLHRPYNDQEYKHTMTTNLIPTNSPTFQIPGHSDNLIYPAPRIVLRIFEDDVVDGNRAIPGSDKIERFCIENHIRSIIDELASDLRDCSRHLSHMYRHDQLPMKHLLIETLLGDLFTLPHPKHSEILYAALLADLNKVCQRSEEESLLKYNYEAIMNTAVKVLFDNLDTMNVTCITRFVKWFSFQLNNTDFLYPWQTWVEATKVDRNSPKAIFVYDVLDRCIRLSFHKKINALVEGSLSSLVPDEFAIHIGPLDPDNQKTVKMAELLKNLISSRASDVEFCKSLNVVMKGVELPDDLDLQEEKHSDKLLKIEALTSTLLELGAKSLSHLSAAFGKYLNLMKTLISIPMGQTHFLQSLQKILNRYPQLLVILVDKFLKVDLFDSQVVCSWIFSAEMKDQHFRSYVWEILSNTATRMRQVVDKLIRERENLKRKSEEELPDGSATPNAEDGDSTMKTEDVPEEAPKDITTEQMILSNERIDATKRSRQEFVLLTMRLFVETLNNHIKSNQVTNFDNYTRWILGRMHEFYIENDEVTRKLYPEIKMLLHGLPFVENSIINLNQ